VVFRESHNVVKESRRTILVVDDDPNEVELIGRAFRKAGFDSLIHSANNSEEAMQYLKGEGRFADRQQFPMPQLVVLDHKMPGSSEWEVLRWVRQQPKYDSLVLVIFSGSDDPNNEKMAYQLGANAYHTKPQNFEDYAQVIKRIGEFWMMRSGLDSPSER
jgi:CheY-like chemotaxis protein